MMRAVTLVEPVETFGRTFPRGTQLLVSANSDSNFDIANAELASTSRSTVADSRVSARSLDSSAGSTGYTSAPVLTANEPLDITWSDGGRLIVTQSDRRTTWDTEPA